MKDKYGKPDTCDECIHYTGSTQICEETKESPFAYETCPCPSKIQVPKKDPIEECGEEIRVLVNRRHLDDDVPHGSKYLEILKKHWPKDKPKGDADKVWDDIARGLSSLGPLDKPTFKKALKAGGFI